MRSLSNLKSGILTGTTFAILPNLYWQDIFRTIILASIGAVVSTIVSYLLQRFRKRDKK